MRDTVGRGWGGVKRDGGGRLVEGGGLRARRAGSCRPSVQGLYFCSLLLVLEEVSRVLPGFLACSSRPSSSRFFLLGGSAVMEGLLATSVPGSEFQGLGSGEEGLGVPILPKYPKTGGCDPSLPAHCLPQIPQAGEFLRVNTLQAAKCTRAACEETSGLSQ